jgi:hypothetical protein
MHDTVEHEVVVRFLRALNLNPFFVSYERKARQELDAIKRDGRNYDDHTSEKLLSVRPTPKRTLWPVPHPTLAK